MSPHQQLDASRPPLPRPGLHKMEPQNRYLTQGVPLGNEVLFDLKHKCSLEHRITFSSTEAERSSGGPWSHPRTRELRLSGASLACSILWVILWKPDCHLAGCGALIAGGWRPGLFFSSLGTRRQSVNLGRVQSDSQDFQNSYVFKGPLNLLLWLFHLKYDLCLWEFRDWHKLWKKLQQGSFLSTTRHTHV